MRKSTTSLLGMCAKCHKEVRLGAGGVWAPVGYGRGFFEYRLDGGANSFVGGVEDMQPSKVWHRGCGLKAREEARNGKQDSFDLGPLTGPED